MRRLYGLLISTCALFAACGGGGGGGSGGGGSNPPGPVTLYVRESGDDDNPGTSTDRALQTIVRAAQLLGPGDTVIVGPGHYNGRIEIERVETTSAAQVELIADPFGELTGDEPGEVVIDAEGQGAAVRIASTPFVTIDGFTITGADSTGIRIFGVSTDATIRNCVINNGGPADGITVENSNDPLIFNNLIFDNGQGIVIDGSQGARIINNTVVDNRNSGISIGGENPSGIASTDATVLNNVIQDSRNNVSIQVQDGPPTSRDGYVGDFNLAFVSDLGDQTKTYRPTVIFGENDINEDAQFVDFGNDDYRLGADSPAIDAGTNDIDSELRVILSDRTTRANDELDGGAVDLGYHFLVPPPAEEE